MASCWFNSCIGRINTRKLSKAYNYQLRCTAVELLSGQPVKLWSCRAAPRCHHCLCPLSKVRMGELHLTIQISKSDNLTLPAAHSNWCAAVRRISTSPPTSFLKTLHSASPAAFRMSDTMDASRGKPV